MTPELVPATAILDQQWMATRLDLARRLYGPASARVLGTIWWYSASSVLVAPPLASLVRAGKPLDPALDAITLHIVPDGRFVGSSSARAFDGEPSDLGQAYRAALEPAIASIAAVSGARRRALWGIAADSLANQLLWTGQATGDVPGSIAIAESLSDGIGSIMPRPRYERVGPHYVVRRVSCCLIDKATGQQKCTSCPNQHPDERRARIQAALG